MHGGTSRVIFDHRHRHMSGGQARSLFKSAKPLVCLLAHRSHAGLAILIKQHGQFPRGAYGRSKYLRSLYSRHWGEQKGVCQLSPESPGFAQMSLAAGWPPGLAQGD